MTCIGWYAIKSKQNKSLRAVLNKSWRQHPTRPQLYGHLPPITKTIQVRRTRNAGHCWRSKDELISDVLLWTPTHGCARVGRPARTYIQQLCEDTGCNPEDLPEAMNDREKWRETVRDIRADGATWWWWYLIYMYKEDLALNNLQWLICHKNQTKPNHIRGSLNKFLDFFVWALLLIVHTWNSSPLRSNLLQLQCTCCTVPKTSWRPHESPLVWACQWPSSQPLPSSQLSHNDSLWAKGITKSHREQGLDSREAEELSWCPPWSNSLWQGWSCGLVHCFGGSATDAKNLPELP